MREGARSLFEPCDFGCGSTVTLGVASGGVSMRRLWGFPQLVVKPSRLFLGAMSRIDPVLPEQNRYLVIPA